MRSHQCQSARTRRTMSNWIGISNLINRMALVAALATGSVLVGATPDVGATAVTLTAQQYNMCSASCGNHATASNLISWFNSTSPWATSVNEYCSGDPISFKYAAYWLPTRLAVAGCGGASYGVVVSAPNPVTTYAYYYTPQGGGAPSSCLPSSSYECRGMICIQANVFGLLYTACSTHLLNSNTSIAEQQANAYTFVATAWKAEPRVLGGDFNLTPGTVPSVYSSNYLAGVYNATFPSSGPTTQFDYLYLSLPAANGASVISPYCGGSPPPSDHCYAFAQWTAKL